MGFAFSVSERAEYKIENQFGRTESRLDNYFLENPAYFLGPVHHHKMTAAFYNMCGTHPFDWKHFVPGSVNMKEIWWLNLVFPVKYLVNRPAQVAGIYAFPKGICDLLLLPSLGSQEMIFERAQPFPGFWRDKAVQSESP